MTYLIRRAAVADAIKMAPLLRPADRAECLAASGIAPEVGLPISVLSGENIYAETEGGEPILLCGIEQSGPSSAWVWMVATPALERFSVPFLRRCRAQLATWHAQYPLLHNYADARNELHLRWLRWLGFSFIALRPHGVAQLPFYEFARLPHV